MSDVPAPSLASEGGYRVQLPTFEGPLDLLLHLIQQHELDVMDIPIGFVTEKYVEYILLMQELSIDVASEYLVMAATLAHIKSKMLLPPSPDADDGLEESDIDPRAELVRRLLEYQKYKQAAAELGSRSVLGRDVFARGLPVPAVDGPAPLAPVTLFKLLDAFQAVLTRAKRSLEHEIDIERISITERINQLSDVLRLKHRVSFEELFASDRTTMDLVVTFLALLEMTRLRMTRLTQESTYGSIQVELAVTDDEIAGLAAQALEIDEIAPTTGASDAEAPFAPPAEPPVEPSVASDAELDPDQDLE